MCTTCGCGGDGVRIDGSAPDHVHEHRHADGTAHSHAHMHDGSHDHSAMHAAPRPADAATARRVSVEEDILARNDALAARNRASLRAKDIFAVNLVSSPGSGKTTLLERTVAALAGRAEVGVIEGDQQTSRDADRIRASGARAVQINTGRGCHLDAHMVAHAIERLAPGARSVLMIENVGNLVCPAAFDLGEAHKVVVLSVTEGEDKPLKYPDMFRRASLMLLNKTDLLPHVDFDVERCVGYARRVNPAIDVIPLSAKTGDGLGKWIEWIERGRQSARSGLSKPVPSEAESASRAGA